MAGIILIHGPWFGGWIWHRLSPVLRQKGYTVFDGDMPGTGQSRADKEKVSMRDQLDQLDRWAQEVNGPVHVVAHAMAGIIGTEFTERFPHQVRSITYLSSLFGAPGEGAITMPHARAPDSRLKFAQDGSIITVTPEIVAELAFSDCTPEDYSAFSKRVEVTSWDPPMLPLDEPTGHWQKVQRGYIMSLENPFVFLAQQHQMTVRHKCSPVVRMHWGHCPFLTQPQETADIIEDIISPVEPAEHTQQTAHTTQPATHLKVVKR